MDIANFSYLEKNSVPFKGKIAGHKVEPGNRGKIYMRIPNYATVRVVKALDEKTLRTIGRKHRTPIEYAGKIKDKHVYVVKGQNAEKKGAAQDIKEAAKGAPTKKGTSRKSTKVTVPAADIGNVPANIKKAVFAGVKSEKQANGSYVWATSRKTGESKLKEIEKRLPSLGFKNKGTKQTPTKGGYVSILRSYTDNNKNRVESVIHKPVKDWIEPRFILKFIPAAVQSKSIQNTTVTFDPSTVASVLARNVRKFNQNQNPKNLVNVTVKQSKGQLKSFELSYFTVNNKAIDLNTRNDMAAARNYEFSMNSITVKASSKGWVIKSVKGNPAETFSEKQIVSDTELVAFIQKHAKL